MPVQSTSPMNALSIDLSYDVAVSHDCLTNTISKIKDLRIGDEDTNYGTSCKEANCPIQAYAEERAIHLLLYAQCTCHTPTRNSRTGMVEIQEASIEEVYRDQK